MGFFLGNVNTLNFSLSVDILMESSPLSCQIKNSIGISKLSPSVKLLGLLLQSGERGKLLGTNLPKVIKTIPFTLHTFSSLHPQPHTVFLCKYTLPQLAPLPHPPPSAFLWPLVNGGCRQSLIVMNWLGPQLAFLISLT